jgi:hypothetical protein
VNNALGGVALEMDRQQRLLDHVFRLLGAASRPHHPALVIGAKTKRELREQRAVGGHIAALACQHQHLQFGFMSNHVSAAGCSVVFAIGLWDCQRLSICLQ